MPEDLTIIISKLENGVSLIWQCGSEKKEALVSFDTLDSIIDQVRAGYIDIDWYGTRTVGETSLNSNTDGSNQV